MSSLTSLDIIVLLLMGGGGLFGAWRGFVSEAIALFAWVAAVIALKLFYDPAAKLTAGFIDSPMAAAILAFGLLFGVVFFGGKLIAASLGARVRNSVLGPLDRVLGFGFGALKGLLIATLGYLLVTIAHDTLFGGDAPRPEWISKARTHRLLDASSRAVVDFVEQRRQREEESST